jgi:hypothetical protein
MVHTPDRTPGWTYLLTAKHVVKPWLDGGSQLYVRFSKEGRSVGLIPIESEWWYHQDDAVDLAVTQFQPEPDPLLAGLHFSSAFLEDIATQSDRLRVKHGIPWPPAEGEETMFIGLTTHITGHSKNSPVVRMGHVAMIPPDPVEGEYGPSEYYLIECQTYPGNSGSPVWVGYPSLERLHEVRFFLLGILSSSFPVRERLLQKRNPRSRGTIAYYNLGLTLVVPVEKILELILSPKGDEMRKTHGPHIDVPKPG